MWLWWVYLQNQWLFILPGKSICLRRGNKQQSQCEYWRFDNINSPLNPATIAKAEEEDWHQFEMKRHAIRTLLETLTMTLICVIPTKLKSLVLVLYNSHCLCCTLTLKYFPHPLINKPYVSQAHQNHENSVTAISKPCDSIGMNG